MGDDSWKLQVSPKVGDALVNIRGYSVSDLEDTLDQVTETTASKIAGTIGLLQAAGNVAGLAAPAAQETRQGPPPRQTPPGPDRAPGRSCVHGAMVQRSGSKNGENWTGYFCPLPRERRSEQCKPVFV